MKKNKKRFRIYLVSNKKLIDLYVYNPVLKKRVVYTFNYITGFNFKAVNHYTVFKYSNEDVYINKLYKGKFTGWRKSDFNLLKSYYSE